MLGMKLRTEDLSIRDVHIPFVLFCYCFDISSKSPGFQILVLAKTIDVVNLISNYIYVVYM